MQAKSLGKITPKNGSITGATNATPIVITSTAHGLATGDYVDVSSVGGNTAANGFWPITVVDANSFSLNGSVGNGAYTSGGTFIRVERITTDATIKATSIRFQVVIGEAGRAFVGLVGMNKTTHAGVLKQLWPTGGGGGVADMFEIDDSDGNSLTLADFYVAVNTASEGVIVAYMQR